MKSAKFISTQPDISSVSNTIKSSSVFSRVGLRMVTVPASSPILLALFFPTTSPVRSVAIGMGPFSPMVAIGGHIPPRMKGLILLSHGTGASVMALHNIAHSLAMNGYLVAAVQHPGDTWSDRSLVFSERYFVDRPKHVSHVLDALLHDPEWADKFPADQIGAVGHSAGAHTILALIGGIADPRRLLHHYTSIEDDSIFCGLGFLRDTKLQVNDELDLNNFDVLDNRIKKAVLMAPIGVWFDPESLLQRITIPLKIYTAAQDVVLVGKYHGDLLKNSIPHSDFEKIEGAGHFSFMAQPNRSMPSPAGDPASDPPGFVRSIFHQKLGDELTYFFDP